MTGRLAGRKAIVVGADPIVIGIATRYVAEGAEVTLVASDAEIAGAALPPGVRKIAVSAEPSAADKTGIAAVAGSHLDILVLGGADVPLQPDWVPVAALSLDQLRVAEDALVARALIAVQACETALKAAGNASIIFLYSPSGYFSDGGWADRAVGYHARHGLMRALASEWGPVRSNMLVPFADTPGFRAFRDRNPEEIDFRVSVTAMRRVGDPVKDIGGAAVFLGSSDTQFVNGMMIHADGGAHLIQPVMEARMGTSK